MADLNTLRELCVKMQDLQRQKEELDETAKALNTQIDILRLKEIPEMMDQMEVRNVTFQGIGRIQLAADLYCSTKAGQKDAAMLWLRDMGLDDMISETYNATSMKALVRRLMVDGAELPECLNVQPFIRASIVKA